jgi:hypothetical protein
MSFAEDIQRRDFLIIERSRNAPIPQLGAWSWVRGPGFGRLSGTIFDIFSTLSAMRFRAVLIGARASHKSFSRFFPVPSSIGVGAVWL